MASESGERIKQGARMWQTDDRQKEIHESPFAAQAIGLSPKLNININFNLISITDLLLYIFLACNKSTTESKCSGGGL